MPILPLGLLPQIVKYLPYRETANLCLVSKAFRQWVVDGRCFLDKLDFSENPLNSKIIEHIASLTNLTSLNIDKKKLIWIDFPKLTTLTNLNELSVRKNFITDIPYFPRLNILRVGIRHQFYKFNALSIVRLTTLTDLSIQDYRLGDELDLSSLIKLEKLSLWLTGMRSLPKGLINLTCLKVLEISNNWIEDLSVLSNMNHITCLAVICVSEWPNIMNTVTKMTNLQELWLGYNSPFYEFQSLTKLKNLNHLCFAYYSNVPPLNSLTNLDIAEINNSQKDFYFLNQLPQLVSLNVSKTQITDTHFSIIGSLTGLQELNIRENPITNAAYFSSLTNLHTLNASKCNFKNCIIGALTGLTSLTNLNLEDNKITYTAASRLKLLPHLVRLEIANNFVDKDEYERFDREVKRIKLNE